MTILDAGLAGPALRTATISVCIPARNEVETVGAVVAAASRVLEAGDELFVIDDGSSDGTARAAAAHGARIVRRSGPAGKGRAMADGLAATTGDIVVFLDADVRNVTPSFVSRLVAPLVADPAVAMAKATYHRPGEGGRVTELLARPLLERLFPDLAFLRQPLAGEVAVRRAALGGLTLDPGYGVEIGMLIDLARRFGPDSIVEVDLGVRAHRNRPLADLAGEAREVLDAVLARNSGRAAPPA